MTKYHLLPIVDIKSPRWHDRVIIPKVKKFKPGLNIITIEKDPNKYVMHDTRAAMYPRETKNSRHGFYQVYVIPLDDLMTISEHAEIVEKAEHAFAS